MKIKLRIIKVLLKLFYLKQYFDKSLLQKVKNLKTIELKQAVIVRTYYFLTQYTN